MCVLQFVVLNAASLQVLYEGRDARHWIRDVRFSPNGELFALASTDNRVSHIESGMFIPRMMHSREQNGTHGHIMSGP
jgi:hypothetical protein